MFRGVDINKTRSDGHAEWIHSLARLIRNDVRRGFWLFRVGKVWDTESVQGNEEAVPMKAATLPSTKAPVMEDTWFPQIIQDERKQVINLISKATSRGSAPGVVYPQMTTPECSTTVGQVGVYAILLYSVAFPEGWSTVTRCLRWRKRELGRKSKQWGRRNGKRTCQILRQGHQRYHKERKWFWLWSDMFAERMSVFSSTSRRERGAKFGGMGGT